MIPLIVILLYLVIVAYIGSAAFRRSKGNTEDFFLAGRSLGPMVFFLSIFATNMTAFAILGSSGAAYRRGIGIFGMMASSSALVIPLSIFLIGTRLWAVGKRFGHQTQVAYFRDRWECSGIGTFLFALSAVMLVPYMIVSIIGGGRVLADISDKLITFEVGALIVTVVVTLNVFLGGMRGVVWVNIFQTILFLLFGAVAVAVINANVPGGIEGNLESMRQSPLGALLARDRIPQEEFWSYGFIPLSSIMFPHMAIMCFSARKMSAFKRTVVLYPVAIMAIWLPCVLLGVLGAKLVPDLTRPDGVLLRMLAMYSPAWLAGLLGAGIISAVMGSDCHQVLALSTMFTKDVFEHYGGKQKYGERGSVFFARAFILVVTAVAYVIALKTSESIFEIAVRYAFSGFAAMAPVMVAALFWKRSTKWGALASGVWVAVCLLGSAYLTNTHKAGDVLWQVGETPVLFMTKPPAPRTMGTPGGFGGGGGRGGAGGGPGAGLRGGAPDGPGAGPGGPGGPGGTPAAPPPGNGPAPAGPRASEGPGGPEGRAPAPSNSPAPRGPAPEARSGSGPGSAPTPAGPGAGRGPGGGAAAPEAGTGAGGPGGPGAMAAGPGGGPAGGGDTLSTAQGGLGGPGGRGAGSPGGPGGPGAGPRGGPGGPGGPGGARRPPFNPDLRFMGFMMVLPMVVGSALMMLLFSLLTAPPSRETIEKYFPQGDES